MNDELRPDDSLVRAVQLLQSEIAPAPGLVDRMAAKRRRQRSSRIMVSALSSLLVVALVLVAAGRQGDGTVVTFSIGAPDVKSVAVVGDFTDWRDDRVHLHQQGAGMWQASVTLKPGRYRFAYVVDHDQWRPDATAPSAPDDFGRPTSIITVVGN